MPAKTKVLPSQRIKGAARDRFAAELAGQYEKGTSIRALAASYGRSYGNIHRLLQHAGVRFRGRGGATYTKFPRAKKAG